MVQRTSKHLGHNSSAHFSGQVIKHACSFSSFQLAQRTSRVKSWSRKREDSCPLDKCISIFFSYHLSPSCTRSFIIRQIRSFSLALHCTSSLSVSSLVFPSNFFSLAFLQFFWLFVVGFYSSMPASFGCQPSLSSSSDQSFVYSWVWFCS